MEAIELYRNFTKEIETAESEGVAAPTMPPLMMAYRAKTPLHYMAKMIELIKSSEIEQTLLVLPFDVTVHLLEILQSLLEAELSVEVVCRMFFFAIEVNFGPLSSAEHLRPLLKSLRSLAFEKLGEMRDISGFNSAALEFYQLRKSERERALELKEAVEGVKEKRKKKKRKEKAMQTAIISL